MLPRKAVRFEQGDDKLVKQRPLSLLVTMGVFYSSLFLLILSWWHYDDFAGGRHVALTTIADPVQTEVDLPAFDAEVSGVNYHVQPLYDYELSGIVVSYRQHDGDRGVHKRWRDYFNVADLCVVWGENAADIDLNQIKFSSGRFTCFYEPRNRAIHQAFNTHKLSNNHLLTDDQALAKLISKVKIGDEVRLQGWLSEYTIAGGGTRGTSTTREDTGNGACETIYVNDFEVLGSMHSRWRDLFPVSLLLVVLSAAYWLWGVARDKY